MMVGGDLDRGAAPVMPFFGDPREQLRECHILNVRSPRRAHYLREKLADMMQKKIAIPKPYWKLACDAAYKHECIAGKQLPKAKKPMLQA